jgi:hypothetical protein
MLDPKAHFHQMGGHHAECENSQQKLRNEISTLKVMSMSIWY